MANRAGEIVFRGTLWFFSGSASRTLVSFGLSIFLARMLPDEEFATAIIIISALAFFQIFAEIGVAVSIIQKPVLNYSFRDNAFYLSISIAIILSLSMYFLRSSIAEFIGQPRIREVIPMLAGVLILRTVYSVYRALLMRVYRFKTVALFEFISQAVYGLIVITLVFYGYGVSSLLLGQLFSSSLLMLMSLVNTKIIPRSRVSIPEILELIKFGGWVAFNRILTQAAGHLDRFLVSALVSPTAMAGYYLAQQLAITAPSLISGSIEQTTIAVYSRSQDDSRRLERQYWRTLRVSMIILVPIIVIPASHAGVLIAFLYGSKWSFTVELFQIVSGYALAGAMGGGVFTSLLYASGKTRAVVFTGLFRLITLPLCIIAGSFFGIKGVAWGLVFFAFSGRIFNQLVLQFAMGISFIRFLLVSFPFISVGLIISALFWSKSSDLYDVIFMSCGQLLLWFLAAKVIAKNDMDFIFEHFFALLKRTR